MGWYLCQICQIESILREAALRSRCVISYLFKFKTSVKMNISFTFSITDTHTHSHKHTITTNADRLTYFHHHKTGIMGECPIFLEIMGTLKLWQRKGDHKMHFSLRRAATCISLNCLELIIKTKQLDADIIRSIHTFFLTTVDICLQPICSVISLFKGIMLRIFINTCL